MFMSKQKCPSRRRLRVYERRTQVVRITIEDLVLSLIGLFQDFGTHLPGAIILQVAEQAKLTRRLCGLRAGGPERR